MNELDDNLRFEYFTSSQMSRLCASIKNGSPSSAFYTYVEEVFFAIMAGRSLEVQVNTIPVKWGKLLECVVFNELGLSYKMEHKNTIVSKTLDRHSGTPDLIVPGVKVGEIKCYWLKKFIAFSLCLDGGDIEQLKLKFPSEYWQVVSNAMLVGVDRAELISFLPTKESLIEIIENVNNGSLLSDNGLFAADYRFMSTDDFTIEEILSKLPYLPENSKMESLNQFEFEIPQEDKEFLTDRVRLAQVELEKLLK